MSFLVGEVAPPLQIERWLRGPATERFEPGTIYVLDFWALWCAPCIALMPHLSTLQERFAQRGVRIIGVIGPDTQKTSIESVETLLNKKREQIRISVAYDALDSSAEPTAGMLKGRTAAVYFKRAQLDGLPTSIVVDRSGRVVWIGQPADLSSVLEAVSNGRWDLSGAAAKYRAARDAEPMLEQLKTDLNKGKVAEAMAKARQLVEGPCSDSSGYLRFIANTMAASAKAGVKGVDLALALDAIRRAEKLSDASDPTVLVVLARIRSLRGELPQAIEAQERAVRLCEPPLKGELEKTLQEYRQGATAKGFISGSSPRHP